jgi:negative regulator of flagellin synthesis FlgM
VSTKINGIDGTQTIAVGASRAVPRPQDVTGGGAQGATEGSSGNASQQVQITDTARQLANLEQTMREFPAVNETRVAQLRTAIEQGTYAVRPQHIADQLLSMEQALGTLPDGEKPELSTPSHPTGK